MNDLAFDALTRRTSLVTLGAAGLTALAPLLVADARNKSKNKTKKKARQKCQAQAAQCLDFLTVSCGDDANCQATAQACCPIIGRCDFSGFIACASAA